MNQITTRDRVLVIAPHPDDESLGAGGVLAQCATVGAHARVLFLTDGDNAPWIQRVAERRWRIDATARASFGARRRLEAAAALRALGLDEGDGDFLGLPDQGLTDAWLCGDDSLVGRLIEALEVHRPSVLVLPSICDLHPDHSAAAACARVALSRVEPADRPRDVWNYLVHGLPTWPATRDVHLMLSPDEQARKRAAIACHASQLAVHRRRYLAMARADEYLVRDGELRPSATRHSIVSSTVEGDRLTLVVRPQPRAGACGPTRLLVAMVHDGATDTATFTLDSRPRHSHDASLAVRRHGSLRYVDVRRAGLAAASHIYVKLERRFGFFDEAGWYEVRSPLQRRHVALIPPPRLNSSTERHAPSIAVIVPCFNVEQYCGGVVRDVASTGATVFAVDDGSTDGTRAALEDACSFGDVRIIAQPENRGKGVSLLAALRQLLEEPFDLVVTMDGDGQHRPVDIPKLVECWSAGACVVIGQRDVSVMSPKRRWGNQFISTAVRWFHPAAPLDTQCGLRAYDRAVAEALVARVPGTRYETELRMLTYALSEGLPIATVPIPTIYLDGNRSSHFRGVVDSVKIWCALADSCGVPRWTYGRTWGLLGRMLFGATTGYVKSQRQARALR